MVTKKIEKIAEKVPTKSVKKTPTKKAVCARVLDSKIKTGQNSKKREIYQFIVELNGTVPLIWRRIQIQSDATYRDLHRAIQGAMGWENCHPHMFEAGNPANDQAMWIGDADEDGFDGQPALPEKKKKLNEYFKIGTPYSYAIYYYDFGDGWEHTVTLEEILENDPKETYPVCIQGERACPPDGCGGVSGYENLLKIIKDSKHPEYKDTMEWLGSSYRPEMFDPADCDFS